jgi:hypothetical protein
MSEPEPAPEQESEPTFKPNKEQLLYAEDQKWVDAQIAEKRVEERHYGFLVNLIGQRRRIQQDLEQLKRESRGEKHISAYLPTSVDRNILRLLEMTANNYQTPSVDNIDLRLHVDKLWELAGERVSLLPRQALRKFTVAPEEQNQP